MLIDGDPEHAAHAAYKNTFGSDEILSVAIDVGDAISPDSFRTQVEAVEAIEAIEGVLAVDALVNETEVLSSRGQLEVTPLRMIIGAGSSAESVDLARRRVQAHPIWADWLVSRDAQTVALQIELDDSDDAQVARGDTMKEIEGVLDERFGVDRYFFAGHPFMKMEIARSIASDLARLMPLTVAVMALVTLVVTSSVAVGGAIVVCVMLSVVWMLGAMGWMGLGLTALTNAAPTILLAIATAYFLHFWSAYQRRASDLRGDAAIRAAQEVFAPTWIASTTTSIGYGTLSLSSVPIVQQFGWALAIGVLAAGAIGTLVLPSVVVLIRPSERRVFCGGESWVNWVLIHVAMVTSRVPRLLVVLGLLVGSLLGIAALGIDVDSSAPNRFGEESNFRRSSEFYRDRLSGDVVETVYLQGQVGTFFQPDVLRRLSLFSKASLELPSVDKVISISDLVSRINWVFEGEGRDAGDLPRSADAVAQLLLLYESSAGFGALDSLVSSDGSQARVLLKADIRSSSDSANLKADLEQLVERFLPDESGRYAVVSTEMLLSKSADVIVSEQLRSALLAIFLILALVAGFFRSVRIAGLMLAPNLAPLAICLGAMSILGIPLGDTTSIIGATAIGIAVDSTIHLIAASRLAENGNLGSRAAALAAIFNAGRPVLVSSAVVVVGFSILLFSDFQSVAELGMLMAITMLCCLVADLLLLPAEIIAFGNADPDGALLVWTSRGTMIESGRIRDGCLEVRQYAGRLRGSDVALAAIEFPSGLTATDSPILYRDDGV